MKKIKFLMAAILSVVLLGACSTGVMADTYGQDTNSNIKTSESNKVVYKEVKLADTALDMPAVLATAGVMASGVGAFFLKKKIA